jgi:hypothetical protein
MKKLFARVTPTCAKEIRKELGDKPTWRTVSKLFHRKLAKATRKNLLSILDHKIRTRPIVRGGEVVLGITNKQVIRAARRAKRVLSKAKITPRDRRGVGKLKCIVKIMAYRGKTFNDKNIFNEVNPLTCNRKRVRTRNGKKNICRTGKDAIKNCEKSLSKKIVNLVESGASDNELLKYLLLWEDDISRGLEYFKNIRAIARNITGDKSRENTMLCPSAVSHIIPKMTSNRGGDSIYTCYPRF